MRAAVYDTFQGPISVQSVADPTPGPQDVIVKVRATGLCLSDWHGWMGHDPDIALPHVPGHELAGVVAAVGSDVKGWTEGERVAVPFVCACGSCPRCASGNQQICDHQSQPGFTHWGSYAEYVRIERADTNLVTLPESIDFVTAASLGCRYATAFRAVADQGRVRPGAWVAVHGCGGVGLAAIQIASAMGAQVVAVDIRADKLEFASSIGANATVNGAEAPDVASAIRALTDGGAHVSLDAFGSVTTAFNSVACLQKRGRHVQVGLMVAEDARAAVPMDRIVADELEIVGSHGLQAHRYPEMLAMIESGAVSPARLLGQTVSLEEAANLLPRMDRFDGTGVTVIDRF
ncbi:MAG: zinc-dependent alcohol dehydrogenase family protein [Rubricoccaceae bacterium]